MMKSSLNCIVLALAMSILSSVYSADSVESRGKPHLCLDNQWSSSFLVEDQPGQFFGSFQRAEEKFWQNAAKVRATVKSSELIVYFDCPIPAGMQTRCEPGRFWAGDRVELFLQPDPNAIKYHHYAVNAEGEGYAGIGMSRNSNSQAKFSTQKTERGFAVTITIPLDELGLADMTPGYLLKGNFMRGGQTAGGCSYWAPTGADWHVIENFAPIIFGTRKAYFEQKYALLQKKFATFQLTKELQKNLADLKQMIATQGDNSGAFNQLEQMFDDMGCSLVQLRNHACRQMIWQPNVWENQLNVANQATPLTTLKVNMPRNSRKMVGFAVSNLDQTAFLGQMKVFAHWPYPNVRRQLFGYQEEWNPFLAGIQFHEGVAIQDVNGQTIHDPIAPLPMNTVLRIPPRSTVPVWMEISSMGLAPSEYSGILVLKNCDGSGDTETVRLDVNVSSTDIEEYHLDNEQGNSVMSRAWQHRNLRDFFVKYHYNYLYTRPRMYLQYDSKAKKWIVPGNIKDLDKLVELGVDSGFDLENLKICFYLCWEHGFAGKPDTPAWEQKIRASLPYWLEYLEKKFAITNDRVVFWPIDEPKGDPDDPKSSMSQALRWCKLLREVAPKAKIVIDPHPYHGSKSKAFDMLAPYCDIFVCYRPELDSVPGFTQKIQNFKKEIWTYNILYKQSKPEIYRRDYWKNCRDGFLITKFWDFDDCSGGDNFDSRDVTNAESKQAKTNDYAMAYVDFNYGTILTSRRMEAAARGFDETRIAWYCRSLLEKLSAQGENVKELQLELNAAIAKGAEGTMAVMDEQADYILSLSEKIIRLDETKNGKHEKKVKQCRENFRKFPDVEISLPAIP